MRYHTAERVAWIASGLGDVTENEVSKRLAGATIDLYGGEPREAERWIGDSFNAVRDYYRQAADADRAIFLFLI
jgi:hypothetical protein